MRARSPHRTHESSPSWTVSKVRHPGFCSYPSPVAQTVKNLPAMQETWVQSPGQEDLLEKEWLPTKVFLLREFQGQRRLAGYSPWGRKESDMTEHIIYILPQPLPLVTTDLLSTSMDFPNPDFHKKESYNTWPFVTGKMFQGWPKLWHVSELCSFLCLKSISLYEQTTICLAADLLMDIWVISNFWLLRVMLL